MSLDTYAAHAALLAQELIGSLSGTEIEELRASLSGVSLREWWRWRDAHEEQIAAFVSATVSQRARKARWKEARLHLTLAAAQSCLEAQALLRAADPLTTGCSYRQMTSLAARAYQSLMGADIPDWPFDGENPFVDRS